jgi:metal-responsive CopG/Arc/MetJ family transcriptional regulator
MVKEVACEKITISLSEESVRSIDRYRKEHKVRTRPEVLITALQVLKEADQSQRRQRVARKKRPD